MIGISYPHLPITCEICDNFDYCLPRWEDDGGSMSLRPSPLQSSEEESEQDNESHDRPLAGECDQPI